MLQVIINLKRHKLVKISAFSKKQNLHSLNPFILILKHQQKKVLKFLNKTGKSLIWQKSFLTSQPDFNLEFFLFFLFSRAINSRRNFSLVVHYSFKFTRCQLLVVKLLVTRCKILSLVVAEVARCKKITRYSLQNSLVFLCRSCSLQKTLVARCKIRSLLVAEVARCKNSHIVKNQLLLVAKIRLLLIA